MNPSENKKKLDELLSRAVGRKPLKFDTDIWQKKYAQEIREYQVRTAYGAGTLPIHKRTTTMKSLIIKFAVAAGIIIAALVGIGLFDNWFGGGNIAFADVLNNFQNRNYSFELALTIVEGDKQHEDSVSQVIVKEPGKMRLDNATPGLGKISSITDFNTGKTLLLFHQNKSAVMMENSVLNINSGAEGVVSLCTRPVSALWNMKDGTEKTLGVKEIDGQKAAGFQVSGEDEYFQYEMTIWAEVANSTPCFVEVVATPKKETQTQIKWTMRKFEMDVPCDESQFSLQPPAGYTLAYQKKLEEMPSKGTSSSTAKKIEESLTLWADGKKDQAVQTLLSIDWSQPIKFNKKPYIFTMTEQGYISLKPEDQKAVMEEVMQSSGTVREIAKYLIAQGKAAVAAQANDKAEQYYLSGSYLGELIAKDPERIIIARLVGIAVQKITLNELVTLYTQTNNQEKLQAAQKQLQTVATMAAEIKSKASGR